MKAEGQAGRVTSSFILHPSSFGRGAHLQRKLHQTGGGGAPLAALTGVEVCDLTFATSVPPLFRAIPQIQS